MIADLDFSFIRLRDSEKDAIDTYSPAAEISYAGYCIHLKPNEPVFQITNSPVNIDFETYMVELIGDCGEVLENITSNIFIGSSFSDSNGVSQISWEWVNQSNFPGRILRMRWTNTVDGKTFWTNYFCSSFEDLEGTTRFDYSSRGYHYGTEYNYAGVSSLTSQRYYQSIRLRMYFNNSINESERQEYHQVSTNVTIAARNIRKWKERYILDSFDDWTCKRLENLLTNGEVYIEGYRAFSSSPVEFIERELGSDVAEGEAVVNKDYSQKYQWVYQEFEGGSVSSFEPTGSFIEGTIFNQLKVTYSANIILQSGTITLYDSNDEVVFIYNESDMSVNDNVLTVNTVLDLEGGGYFFNITAGLVSFLGSDSLAVSDQSTWNFSLQASDFDANDYDNDDYLT